jgi:glucose-6-phosphate isomerase
MNYIIVEDKLEYDKNEYTPAVAWTKSFEDGKYAYRDNAKDIGHQTKKEDVLYFGARYMEKTKDEEVFVDNDFMADLTVINPGKVGEEFVKTVGHYHQNVQGLDIAYPEVYEAVTDGLEYLLQSEPDKEGKVDVLWVVTTAGDKVVMVPGYGHVGTNVGDKLAIEVDIQKRDNPKGSDYSMFKEKVGGAFYRTIDGLVKNPNYEVNSLRIVKPNERPDWGLVNNVPLYDAFVANPEKFDYLLHPDKYDFSLDGLFSDIEL